MFAHDGRPPQQQQSHRRDNNRGIAYINILFYYRAISWCVFISSMAK